MPIPSASSKRRTIPLVALALSIALGACTKGGGGTDAAACKPAAEACSAASDCCSGNCTGNVCVDPPACRPLASACDVASDCCSGACSSQICVAALGQCKALTAACTSASECCTGACTGGACAVPAQCGGLGDPCAANEACCSGRCDATKCVSADYCKPVNAACDTTRPSECCTLSCLPTGAGGTAGTCAVSACRQASTQCSADSDCCSGICSGTASASGSCQAVPTGSTGFTCKTLGEGCGAAADCCSENCKGGACVQAYSCQAYGDICYAAKDCCSGLCDAANGNPGRCIDAPGGCVQGGNPCDSGSNCCSRICKDMGTGVKVCVPAGGCRMTDEYCDSSGACCGGSGGYGVYCDQFGKTPPDTGTHDDSRCSRGQSCNPPGNICGVTTDVNASQNCCVPGDFNGSGKAVCKPDTNGVYRCYGSPAGGGTGTSCPTGYDASNPLCCIAADQICQFKDQCCGGAPCVPDSSGVLRCSSATACTATGDECGGASDTSCCQGACTYGVESGWRCQAGGTPGACRSDGASCSFSGECCTGTCDAGTCGRACLGVNGTCTTAADCCTGLGCDIPPGATSGTCKAPTTAPSCAATAGACSATTPCCDSADACTNGVCVAASVCGATSHVCSADADCCSGLLCVTTATDGSGGVHMTACPPGAACSCEQPPPQYCVPPPYACSPSQPCCFGYCASTAAGRAPCDGSTPCTCFDNG